MGGSTIPGQYVLPEFVGRFRTMYPEARVTLAVGDTSKICEKVLKDGLEVGLVGAVMDEERLVFIPIMDSPVNIIRSPAGGRLPRFFRRYVVLAVWPGHPLVGHRITPGGLTGVPAVLRKPSNGTRIVLTRTLAQADMDLEALEGARSDGLHHGRLAGGASPGGGRGDQPSGPGGRPGHRPGGGIGPEKLGGEAPNPPGHLQKTHPLPDSPGLHNPVPGRPAQRQVDRPGPA
ncbi:hypothetical protein DFAR_1870013 [Desulfarculales bacterium]